MANLWEEEFWLKTSILNSVLGIHFILRKFFFSWSPALPIFGAVAADQCLRLLSFTSSHRHQNYFITKRKMFESLCLEIIVVSLSECMFASMGYRRVALFAWLAYGIPGFWAALRPPCQIPQILAVAPSHQPFLGIGGFVLWGFWHGNEGYISQVAVGFYLFGQSSELFVYHLYMEADRIMRNAEYYEWLVQEIRRGAIDATQMLVDLFMARGVFLPAIIASSRT